MSTNPGSSGYMSPKDMLDLLDHPESIGGAKDGKGLRIVYEKEHLDLKPQLLSKFALACFIGILDVVKQGISTGSAPDLVGTETPIKIGYASLVVLGAQRINGGTKDSLQHLTTLRHLLQQGAPPDVPDSMGYTALHHSCASSSPQPTLARVLLQEGADPNYRNRYGEIPIFAPFRSNNITLVDLLMKYGTNLDIVDVNGDPVRSIFVHFGPQVTATVRRWERKRMGEDAPLDDKRCEGCSKKAEGRIKQCSNCHTVRYCSTECQRADWQNHKSKCQPFSAPNVVTLRPDYQSYSTVFSRADFARQALGIPEYSASERRHRPLTKDLSDHEPNKSLVVKVQVPLVSALILTGPDVGDLLVYNKKKDFICNIRQAENRGNYEKIVKVVRAKGINGIKAYFAAELKNRYELVVKISEVLAEQPF
ncbi:hypothetical protein SERLA73DRAFT_176639 [Serpula lacrymans var. lacrymans S7.3]|uniref:MYND-type domain-containing protein n=2 Tax=Serpula lacrymans var. lacrymans TaxID=341189 RepID=F8PND7_SERL3|nr:uncharacterized protein SERLADRAFT_459763 [Serpula lacrymans var. lacrymans S7.9]EGO03119.1 hypothetical protein SERLA73DRAFT_176639 [Serpula lacrymans var. lacrymans S7.3]EGO28886.1 hypothetical protein SERLADRAFT_459763 [Serpula lacrymans var. lacrymans S7.9]